MKCFVLLLWDLAIAFEFSKLLETSVKTITDILKFLTFSVEMDFVGAGPLFRFEP